MKLRISRRLRLVGCFLAWSTVASGQMRNMADESESALKNVHKVAVFINMGQTLPARYKPDYDRAKKQIAKKLDEAKLTLVPDPKDADLVLVMREYDADTGKAIMAGTVAIEKICLADDLKVYKGGKQPNESDPPIWSVDESCGYSWPANRAIDKLLKKLK